jgi:hypothetical protein
VLSVFGHELFADDSARVGWPLQFYEEGGFAYRRTFNLQFLLISTAIMVAFPIIPGWIYSRSKWPLPK